MCVWRGAKFSSEEQNHCQSPPIRLLGAGNILSEVKQKFLLFHRYQLQGPISSGTLTGLTNILDADSFVKRLDTFQITATYSKHWVQVEINKCCRQYGFTSYSTNLAKRNLVKREDRSQREEMWHRERLYLEATKWEQEEVMAKGKNLSLPWSALHATQYFKSHNWESFSNFPWVPREQDLGSQ